MKVTTDDLLEAIRQSLLLTSDTGFTVSDLAQELNYGNATIRQLLHKLNRAGHLEVTRVRRTDLSGRAQTIPAYRIKK